MCDDTRMASHGTCLEIVPVTLSTSQQSDLSSLIFRRVHRRDVVFFLSEGIVLCDIIIKRPDPLVSTLQRHHRTSRAAKVCGGSFRFKSECEQSARGMNEEEWIV